MARHGVIGVALATALALGIGCGSKKDDNEEPAPSPAKQVPDEPPAQRAPELPKEVPADLQISYESGPVAVGDGTTTIITIAPRDGGGFTFLHEEVETDMEGEEESRKKVVEKELTAEQLLPLFQELARQKFLDLEDDYEDPDVADGGTYTVKVSYGDATKAISVTNAKVAPVEKVTAAMLAVGK